jgi:hypothetical protein
MMVDAASADYIALEHPIAASKLVKRAVGHVGHLDSSQPMRQVPFDQPGQVFDTRTAALV